MTVRQTTLVEHGIETGRGKLFTRTWLPDINDGRAPIVMLHDSLGCVQLWRDFPQAVCAATGRRVVAYDRLGFGRSDPHPGRLGLDFIADEADSDFLALTLALGIERFIVFGHSVGGGMAVNCAARFGEACIALLTESAQAFVEDRTRQGIEDARRSFADPDQLRRLEKYHGDKAAWVLGAWIDTWLDPAFANWSLAPVLPGVRCPALVIHGADDEYGSPLHPRLIAECAGGGAQLEIMDGTRHVPHREREHKVIELLRRFTQDLG